MCASLTASAVELGDIGGRGGAAWLGDAVLPKSHRCTVEVTCHTIERERVNLQTRSALWLLRK